MHSPVLTAKLETIAKVRTADMLQKSEFEANDPALKSTEESSLYSKLLICCKNLGIEPTIDPHGNATPNDFSASALGKQVGQTRMMRS